MKAKKIRTVPSINATKRMAAERKITTTKVRDPNKRFIFVWLLVPFFLSFLFFVLGVIAVMNTELQSNPAMLNLAVASMSVMTISLMFLPSYLLAMLVYWWATTKKNFSQTRFLWAIPFISTALCWFPTFLLAAPAARTFQGFLIMAASSLAIWFIWITFMRLVLRFGRKI